MEPCEMVTLSQAQRRDRQRMAITTLCAVLFVWMSFLMVWHMLRDFEACDYSYHVGKANSLNKGMILPMLLKGDDILWHTITWFFMRLGLGKVYGPSLVMALVNGAYYLLACGLMQRNLKGRGVDSRLVPLFAMALCVVSAIYMPWFEEEIYLPHDSPNPWHNPTQLMARPFALVVFVMTAWIYQRLKDQNWEVKRVFASRGEAVLYSVLILLSVWAKPSFVQCFVPGLGAYMLVDIIRSRGKAFFPCFRMCLAYVPAAIITLNCYFMKFGEDSSAGVAFEPFVYWSKRTDSIPLSILLLFAFPILVYVVDWKRLGHSAQGQLSIWVGLVGLGMRALLIETGSARWHGNLTWAYGIASGLIWFVALEHFLELMSTDRLSERKYKVTAYLGWILLFLHVLTGVYYYFHVLHGTRQC